MPIQNNPFGDIPFTGKKGLEQRLLFILAKHVSTPDGMDENGWISLVPADIESALSAPAQDAQTARKIIGSGLYALQRHTLTIGSKNGDWQSFPLIAECRRREDGIQVRVEPFLKRYFSDYYDKASRLDISEYSMLKSGYSRKLYELVANATENELNLPLWKLGEIFGMEGVFRRCRCNAILTRAYREISMKTTMRFAWGFFTGKDRSWTVIFTSISRADHNPSAKQQNICDDKVLPSETCNTSASVENVPDSAFGIEEILSPSENAPEPEKDSAATSDSDDAEARFNDEEDAYDLPSLHIGTSKEDSERLERLFATKPSRAFSELIEHMSGPNITEEDDARFSAWQECRRKHTWPMLLSDCWGASGSSYCSLCSDEKPTREQCLEEHRKTLIHEYAMFFCWTADEAEEFLRLGGIVTKEMINEMINEKGRRVGERNIDILLELRKQTSGLKESPEKAS